MPIAQRILLGAGATALTTLSTKLALDTGSEISKRSVVAKAIIKSPHANLDVDKIPSPSYSNFYINSPLENGDVNSPLENLLLYSITLDILILLLLLIILLIIFNRYFYVHNAKLVNSKLDKYIPNKIKNWLYTSIDFNNKFILFMFIFIGFFILFDSLLNVFISMDLYYNLDEHIEVHKYLKLKKS